MLHPGMLHVVVWRPLVQQDVVAGPGGPLSLLTTAEVLPAAGPRPEALPPEPAWLVSFTHAHEMIS